MHPPLSRSNNNNPEIRVFKLPHFGHFTGTDADVQMEGLWIIRHRIIITTETITVAIIIITVTIIPPQTIRPITAEPRRKPPTT